MRLSVPVLPRCCPNTRKSQGRKNRAKILNQNQRVAGAPEEIRTPDPQIRSLVLYPAELRALTKSNNGEGFSNNGLLHARTLRSVPVKPLKIRALLPSLLPI